MLHPYSIEVDCEAILLTTIIANSFIPSALNVKLRITNKLSLLIKQLHLCYDMLLSNLIYSCIHFIKTAELMLDSYLHFTPEYKAHAHWA